MLNIDLQKSVDSFYGFLLTATHLTGIFVTPEICLQFEDLLLPLMEAVADTGLGQAKQQSRRALIVRRLQKAFQFDTCAT